MKHCKRIATVLLFSLLFIIPNAIYAQNSGSAATTESFTYHKAVDAVTQATSPGWSLSYEKIWGKRKYENLVILRTFRDDFLSRTELGQAYLSLLYNNSIEIAFLLMQKPALQIQTREVLNAVIIELKAQSGNNELCISQNTIDAFVSLLENFQIYASPRLKAVIEIVKEDIEAGEISGQLGFTIGEY